MLSESLLSSDNLVDSLLVILNGGLVIPEGFLDDTSKLKKYGMNNYNTNSSEIIIQ